VIDEKSMINDHTRKGGRQTITKEKGTRKYHLKRGTYETANRVPREANLQLSCWRRKSHLHRTLGKKKTVIQQPKHHRDVQFTKEPEKAKVQGKETLAGSRLGIIVENRVTGEKRITQEFQNTLLEGCQKKRKICSFERAGLNTQKRKENIVGLFRVQGKCGKKCRSTIKKWHKN